MPEVCVRASAAALACLLLLFHTPAGAAGLDATGTYRGPATELISCTDGSSGVRNLQTLMVVQGQSTGAFTADTTFTGTETFNGVTQPFVNQASPFVGTVNSDGSTLAQFQAVPPIVTTGNLSGDTWNLSYSTVFGICTFNLSMTIVRDSVDPATSPSSTLTGSTTLLSSTRAISSLQQVRIGSLFAKKGVGATRAAGGFMLQGAAAGEGSTMPIGGWLSYSRSDAKNDFATTAFSSDRITLLGGVDTRLHESVVVGLALGYEKSDVSTVFNAGSAETRGVTAAPYVAFLVSDRLLVDASVGVSSLETDQTRTGAAAPVRSSFRARRGFLTLNASYGFEWGNVLANLNTGLLWAKETQRGFVESDGTVVPSRSLHITQALLGGDIAYSFGNYEPYLRLTYERDISTTRAPQLAGGVATPSQDNSGVVGSLGLRYFHPAGVSAQLEVTRVMARRNFSENLFTATIRGEF